MEPELAKRLAKLEGQIEILTTFNKTLGKFAEQTARALEEIKKR